MKNILLILSLSFLSVVFASANPINATVASGVASLPPQTNSYYFIAWTPTTANGVNKNSRMAFEFIAPAPGRPSKTSSPWNLQGFTTYAECTNYVATNSIVPALPPQKPGQP